MRTPTYIRSAEDFTRSVTLGRSTETAQLEFKANYAPQPSLADEIRKDISAMANTWGGCILVGVAEGSSSASIKVAKGLVTIDCERIRNTSMDSLAGRIYPRPEVEPSFIYVFDPAGHQHTILALNVEPMVNALCSCVEDNDRLVHYYRDDFGVKRLPVHEVHRRMNNTGRRYQILVNNLQLVGKVMHVASPVWYLRRESGTEKAGRIVRTANALDALREPLVKEPDARSSVIVEGAAETHLVLNLNGQSFSMPYGLVADMWTGPTGDGHVAFNCPITYDSISSRVVLEVSR
jgi:hypothetical protein